MVGWNIFIYFSFKIYLKILFLIDMSRLVVAVAVHFKAVTVFFRPLWLQFSLGVLWHIAMRQCSINSVLALPTCDTEHLQADERLERRGSQSAEVISAKVQQGQRWQARQSLLCQQLYAVFLQVKFLQTLQQKDIQQGNCETYKWKKDGRKCQT